MLGKASEIKTYIAEDNETVNWFLSSIPTATVIDMKFAAAYNNDRIWTQTLIIYKEESA